MTASTPRRRLFRSLFQFRLRSLLILMTLVALALSTYYGYVPYYEEQHEAGLAVSANGAKLEWEPMRPGWLRSALGLVADEEILRDCISIKGDHGRIRNADLVHLEKMRHLKRLYLERCPIDDKGLQHLSGLHELERLSLWGTKITDEGLRHIGRLPALKVLDIHCIGRRAMVGDTIVCGSQSIGEVDVTDVYNLALSGNLTPQCLEHLGQARALRTLNFSFSFDDAGLHLLARVPNVRMRTLIVRDVTKDGLATLRRFPDLETLIIVGSRLDAEGLMHLSSLPRLKKLELRAVRAGKDDWLHLARLTQVEEFSASATRLEEDGMRGLGGLDRLETVFLSRSGATDENIAHLSGCRNLRHLDLTGEELTADALNNLGPMEELRVLEFCGALDDEAIGCLSRMRKLERLAPCPRESLRCYLTASGVAELVKLKCFRKGAHVELNSAEDGAGVKGVDIPEGAKSLSDSDLACIWETLPFDSLSLTGSDISVGGLRWGPDLLGCRYLGVRAQRPLSEFITRELDFGPGLATVYDKVVHFSAARGIGPQNVNINFDYPACPLELLKYIPRTKCLKLAGHDHQGRERCDWDQLQYVPDLEELAVMQPRENAIDAAGIRRLGEMDGLRRLECAFAKDITPDEFAPLGKLKNLTDLQLTFDGLTPAHVAVLGKLEKLQVLHVQGTPGAFEGPLGLEHLVNLQQLTELQLYAVSDEDMPFLGQLEGLRRITLSWDRVTDEAFSNLAELPFLTYLVIEVEEAHSADRRHSITEQIPNVFVRVSRRR